MVTSNVGTLNSNNSIELHTQQWYTALSIDALHSYALLTFIHLVLTFRSAAEKSRLKLHQARQEAKLKANASDGIDVKVNEGRRST